MQDVVVVLTTLPAEGDVGAFARTLVEEHLAACVNVHAPMTSIYWWDGKVQEDAERQLTIKTSADRVQALQARIHELHPYDLPEFLVLTVADASEAYSRWVRSSTESALIRANPRFGVWRLDLVLCQRLLEVVDQVVRVLDPDRDPHEAVG